MLIFVVGAAIGIWSEVQRQRAIRKFVARGCAGRAWRRAFPEVEAEKVQKFVAIFADAFGLHHKAALNMRPADRPMDLYRAIHCGWHVCDSLEFECFMRNLEKTYGVNWREIRWEEATLGEVFGRAMRVLPRPHPWCWL